MYQKIVIVGNLGRNPEMRYMPDGTAVTNMNVATNRRYTNRQTGEPVNETTWFRVSVWGRQAETANQYLSRGRKVLVEGQLMSVKETGGPRTFTRNDGTVGASFEIRADTVRFLSSADEGSGQEMNGAVPFHAMNGSEQPVAAVEEEDDIPF